MAPVASHRTHELHGRLNGVPKVHFGLYSRRSASGDLTTVNQQPCYLI